MYSFPCQICFLFPAVVRAWDLAVCPFCLVEFQDQLKPKYFCIKCEKSKHKGDCATDSVDATEFIDSIKRRG